MSDVRQGPSGPITQRIIASGRTKIPAGKKNVIGETYMRRGNERVWVYVFPVTPIPSTELPDTRYGIVGIPSKTKGMLEDEWAPTFLIPDDTPFDFDIFVEWTIFGTAP
jgi:hypothetical protein